MFKIAPIQNPEMQAHCATLCGVLARDGYFAYSMTDSESCALMGFSQFEIRDGEGYISDLLPTPEYKDDFEAMFILGRQTMNFIDLCGVHTAKASATAGDERLIKAIGFKPLNGEYFCDMTGFFDGHCDGTSKNG